jgi:transposase
MKTFKRIKTINGIEYQYEITPYYDPKTKTVRQKSTYIGKYQEGKVVKVREKKIKDVFSFGEFLPIQKIISHYKLDKFLSNELGKIQSQAVIALSLGRLLKGLAMQNISNWYDGTWLYYQTREIPLSPSSISRLLSTIGETRLHDKLAAHLIKQLKSKRTLLYDITSVSSYSELIKLLEWGYNRDNYDLPQINLSVILDKQEGIPLGYEIYPGSISDVSTLHNTIKKINTQGVRDFTLVLDRGFFSLANIDLLIDNYTDFVMAVPERYKSVEQLLSKIAKEIERPKYLKKFNDEVVFVKQVEIKTGSHKLKGFCYYNPARAQQEKDSFYKRLLSLKDLVERLKPSARDAKFKIKDILGNLYSYFAIQTINDQFQVEIKEKSVSRRLNKKGLFLISYSGEHSWDSCLSVYKERELIERSFNILKNDLELSTPNVHKDTTLKGILFISLLALIIRMKIMNTLKQADMIKDYSFEKMMLQLEKMKAVILDNGQVMYSEITKKQRDLLAPFDAVPKI